MPPFAIWHIPGSKVGADKCRRNYIKGSVRAGSSPAGVSGCRGERVAARKRFLLPSLSVRAECAGNYRKTRSRVRVPPRWPANGYFSWIERGVFPATSSARRYALRCSAGQSNAEGITASNARGRGFESRPCRHQWQGSSEVEHVTISSPLVDCPALRRAV